MSPIGLFAKDRPYKEQMRLSQALVILNNMCNNGYIDPDLHDVFVRSGVFRKYAEGFMAALQSDC